MMKKSAILLSFLCSFCSLFAQFNTSSTSPEALDHYRDAREMANPIHAKQAFQLAIAADTNFVDAYDQLAALLGELAQYDSARHYYQLSLDKYPRGIRAHEGLARLYQIQGDFESALNQYQELLRHYPNYPPAYYGMALIHFSENNFPETIRDSEQALRLYLAANRPLPAADARMLAAQAYQSIGNYQEALKYLKASKKQFGDKPYYHYRVGMCYFMMGKSDKAEDCFVQAEQKGYKVPTHVRKKNN
jgi:tetratricopeptide (TPR) repeat protein